MFKVFSFQLGDILNVKNLEKINGIMQSFLDNIDISEFLEENSEAGDYEEKEIESNQHIDLKQYEDMYLLTIDLKGVDLRELSIRYDPGILEINLNRLEVEKRGVGIISNNVVVKRAYNRKFENIEDIETDKILKSIDNGILSIRMPKKYSLNGIIDVDFYEDNVDN